MKISISIIILIILFAFIAHMRVQFSPFKIHFDKPILAIGTFFVVLGILFISYHFKREGLIKGYGEGCEDMRKVVIEILKEHK